MHAASLFYKTKKTGDSEQLLQYEAEDFKLESITNFLKKHSSEPKIKNVLSDQLDQQYQIYREAKKYAREMQQPSNDNEQDTMDMIEQELMRRGEL